MFRRICRLSVVLAVVAAVVVLGAPRATRLAHAVFQDTDGDNAIDIAEQISGSDVNNADSYPENTAVGLLIGRPVCSDGLDNDLDARTDEADPGCHDTDNDLAPDDIEVRLGSNPTSAASFPEDARIDATVAYYLFPLFNLCGDNVDNDLDGLTDAADPGCSTLHGDNDAFDDMVEKLYGSDPGDANSVPEHETPNPGSCSDGIDNDLDGNTDSADTACGIPANDDRANATAISSLPYTDGLHGVKNATADLGDPNSSCGGRGLSTWYRYQATADGVLIADSVGSTLAAEVTVWRQKDTALSEVGCDFRSDETGSVARVAFGAEAGATYFIEITGYASDTAPEVTFHLTTGTPPANDSLSTLENVAAIPFTDTVDTSDATVQSAEPDPYCMDVRYSVWYRFTPSVDTLLIADTDGSDYPAGIGVWTDSKFGLTQVACAQSSSPSSFPFPGPLPTPGPEPELEPARAVVRALAGKNYYFQVGGDRYGPAFGNLVFHIEQGAAPANDNFADATNANALPFSETVDTLTASTEKDEPSPNCAFGSSGSTVWYRYTAPADGYVKASTDSNEYVTQLAVYQGASIADLTLLGCTANYPFYSPIGLRVTAGETYYFQASSTGYSGFFSSGSGSGDLTFELEELVVPPCAAGEFSVSDPTGDQRVSLGFPIGGSLPEPLDIVSLDGGSDLQSFCLRVGFAGPLPATDSPAGAYGYISFDTDEDPRTGFSGNSCAGGFGGDITARFAIRGGIIAQLYPNSDNLPPQGELPFGIVQFDDHSFTLIVPLKALGGDDHFAFTAEVENYGGSDCAPNAGSLTSPDPARPGDVNCDGLADAIDVTLILQQIAGLFSQPMPCQFAGDVNGSGDVGPVDATLILQYSSGMLAVFPSG